MLDFWRTKEVSICPMIKQYHQVEKHFSKHPNENALVHSIAGIGIGILIARPFAGVHPMRWGVALLVLALLGHLKPLILKN